MAGIRDRFIFDEGQHRFTVNGRIVPGVTGLILAGNLIDQSTLQYFNEEAKWRGTRVHKACMDIDLQAFSGEALVEDAPYIESYLQWRAMARMRWTRIEEPRYSRRYRFAGIADRIGYDRRGLPIVLDLKTGVVQKWHRIQLALYDLLNDDLPWGIRRRVTLYLQKDGSCAKAHEHSNKIDYVESLRLLKEAA